jgi:hypothetical protein
MKRRLLLVAVGVAVAVMPLGPGVAGGQIATEDAVTGTTTLVLDDIIFDAHSGPSGEDPTGTVTVLAAGRFPAVAQVTCLRVIDNHASIGTTLGTDPRFFLWFVEDNDSIGSDRFAFLETSDLPIACPSGPPPGVPLITIGSGDIMVTDAQPLPSTRDQCKNGGWQIYGVFKNQGDCVSFVATGGKNPPDG